MTYSSRKRKSTKAEKRASKVPFLGNLRNIELVGIGLILLAGMMYALSRCSRDEPQTVVTEATTSVEENTTHDENQARTAVPAAANKVYVCIDSFKLRTGYHLNDSIISYLPFGEELIYLDKSNFEQTIKFSATNKATEPWVKVQTKKGQIGWVFGAGIRPYRKHEASLEE